VETKNNMPAPWWGPTTVPVGTSVYWQIGPMSLWVQRLPAEWRIARETIDEVPEPTVVQRRSSDCEDLLGHASLSRFGVGGIDEHLIVQPALADRPVVSTPQRPFIIPAGEEVTLYIGSPLWLQLLVGPKRALLEDVPVLQPPDTWFGPNTQVGEICYASRSFCRLQPEGLNPQPHRVITSVLVQNHASSALYLDRIQLPVPYLSLFMDPATLDLWTNDVILERVEGEGLDPLRITSGPPAAVPSATAVAPPRKHTSGNIMVRAFATLFSEKQAARE
tara:strand:+ start:69867 stop:70697 length:831 start_codon:yes stop_codon:yes gene_type:complete